MVSVQILLCRRERLSQTLSHAVYVGTDALAAWGARASAPRRRRCGPCQTACAVVASLTRKKSAKCAGFIHCVGRVIDRANIIAQDQGSGGASSAHKSFVRSLPRALAEQLWLKRVDLQRALLEETDLDFPDRRSAGF